MTQEKFTFFWGGPFSQWYPRGFIINDIKYSTAEQYMMAMKARQFNDKETESKILATTNPREQKILGRQVKSYNDDVWNSVARGIVYTGNYAKFTQHDDLKKILLDTIGTTLVEASPTDCKWGIGLSKHDSFARDRTKWRGLNWLGEVLMKVRQVLKEKQDFETLGERIQYPITQKMVINL